MSPSNKMPAEDTPETKASVSSRPPTTSSDPSSSQTEPDLDDFLELEGTTKFSPPPAPTYRYSLSLQDGKLCIWLEDCESKKQWCTARRSLCDYVDLTNAIPTASAADYVKYFHDLIDANHDGVDSFPITLQPLTGNNFQLQIVLKVQVMEQPRVATYTFTMEPISLERFDVMGSKVRDLKSELSTEEAEWSYGPALQKLGGVVAAQSSKLKQLDGDLAYLNSAVETADKVVVMHNAGLRRIDTEVQSLNGVVETLRGELSCNGAVSQLRDEVEVLRIAHDRVDSFCLRANCRVGSYIRWGNIPDGVVEIQTCGTFYVSVVVNYQTHFSRDFIHAASTCNQSAAATDTLEATTTLLRWCASPVSSKMTRLRSIVRLSFSASATWRSFAWTVNYV
ncbi:uncharacterized protein KRP23_9549 [Phytophthora ramorum]|uniref:uncharacterized protein n=1 Tax=Phytophthora ramorum TaxID=164328 RepID=UPI0030AA9158|nr:hypothetical protein KRP23_9549 [Phytophthora ramorum]